MVAPTLPPPMLLASVPPVEGEAVPVGPNEVIRTQAVFSLPGELDEVPVFNSNSPELVQEEGILLSTFPPDGMVSREAHLDFAFSGRFDFFAHHVARGLNHDDRRTLFLGAVIYNPSPDPATLSILQGVSYLSQEAPFNALPSLVSNPTGTVFAGPGSRTVTDILQGRDQGQWPEQVTIPPREAYLLMNAPIPLRRLPFAVDATLPPGSILPTGSTRSRSSRRNRQLPSNGRSALMYLSSNRSVYGATLAMYAPQTSDGKERAPTLQEWLSLLVNGDLAGPRDISPTDPDEFRKSNEDERFFYGRVAGVAQGSQWNGRIADDANGLAYSIPEPGTSVSYVLNTVDHNTFGTTQIQSAPMLVRYPDTAYRAHGNYGVHYRLSLPAYNDTDYPQRIVLKVQTPLQDEALGTGLRFRRRPDERIFFRGTVRVRYRTRIGSLRSRYVHLVQHQGQEGEPLLQLTLEPGDRRPIDIEFIYPPDATPPQVLTITTLANPEYVEAMEAEPNEVTSEAASEAIVTDHELANIADDDATTDDDTVRSEASETE
ncbi:MAG: DUF3370 domain-containing protein [Cyanobacteria bacterium P01_H01_bin.58]